MPWHGTWHKICFVEVQVTPIHASVRWLLVAFASSLTLGCGSLDPAREPQPNDLRINEVVSNNEGVYVDELGEADD